MQLFLSACAGRTGVSRWPGSVPSTSCVVKRHLSGRGETSNAGGVNANQETLPTDRIKIPHIVVYALGNYPYPLSRHSLPQSLLPFILQRYALSAATGTTTKGNRDSASIANKNALTLMKKHDCWIGGGLIDIGSTGSRGNKTRQTVEFEEAGSRAVLTLVKPRVLMNIAGRPLPFLLRSANELPHVISTTADHVALQVDPSPTLVVLHDSLEIPPMTLTKPRRNVGPQGHNGLRSIEASLGTRDFWRIGLGIGRPSGGKSRGDGIRDWVLGDLEPGSEERLFWEGEGVASICDALTRIASSAVDRK